jgi:Zn-dependent protease
MPEILQQVSVWVLPVMAAIILHEVAHGLVAYRLGDPTAARRGRLTLNPIPHIDPIGTIALPLFLVAVHAPFVFGWAKPVPVNFANLPNPKRDMVKVAAAGPLTNVALALVSATIMHLLIGVLSVPGGHGGLSGAVLTPLAIMARNSVIINVVLAVFNLIPILPLDGGRVLAGLLPVRQAIAFARLERYGMLIVTLLLFTQTLGRIMGPVINLALNALL